MTDNERLARMSRKEIHAEIIHLSREQEEYEREIAYLKEQLEDRDRQIAELQSVIDSECPLGSFDLVTSLRAHKQHLMDRVAELQEQNAIMLEALEEIRVDQKGRWEEMYDFADRLQERARVALAKVRGERSV